MLAEMMTTSVMKFIVEIVMTIKMVLTTKMMMTTETMTTTEMITNTESILTVQVKEKQTVLQSGQNKGKMKDQTNKTAMRKGNVQRNSSDDQSLSQSGLGKPGAGGGLKGGKMDTEEAKEARGGGKEEDVFEFKTSSKEATQASSQGSGSLGNKRSKREEGNQRKKRREEGVGAGNETVLKVPGRARPGNRDLKTKKFLDSISDSGEDDDDPPYSLVIVKKTLSKAKKKRSMFDKVIMRESEEANKPKDDLETEEQAIDNVITETLETAKQTKRLVRSNMPGMGEQLKVMV